MKLNGYSISPAIRRLQVRSLSGTQKVFLSRVACERAYKRKSLMFWMKVLPTGGALERKPIGSNQVRIVRGTWGATHLDDQQTAPFFLPKRAAVIPFVKGFCHPNVSGLPKCTLRNVTVTSRINKKQLEIFQLFSFLNFKFNDRLSG